jgi:hypothetical protein
VAAVKPIALLIIAALAVLAWLASERAVEERQRILITPADYQECVIVRTAPLLRSPEGRVDYRLGTRFNDKGVS